ncbi:MAG: hypothetical protein ABW194_06740 [Novosphingobium sp.]
MAYEGSGEGLGERIGEIMRESAVNQAKAYRDYGQLLDRLGTRDIKTTEFAREALDLYIGALGKAASSGVTLVSQTLSAGIKGVSRAASVAAEVAEASENAYASGTAYAGDAVAQPAPKRAAARTKTPSASVA